MKIPRILVIAAAATLSMLSPAAAQKPEPLPVMASFSILADFVRAVGGERVAVDMLVGPDADAHVFTPAPADARRVAAAKLIVVNGLGFEGWLDRLLKSAGSNAPVVVASRGVTARSNEAAHDHDDDDHDHDHDDDHDDDHDHDDHAGHDHGDTDPHAWQSVANARIYVGNIRDALIAADPAGRAAYEANTRNYLGQLDALDRDLKETLARIPAERRHVISTHQAFGYFTEAYGIAFKAPVGVSTEQEASARDVAQLIAQIRREKAPAVFLENISDPRLARRIAEETGAKIGGTLYSDALTKADGPAPTYLDMMRHNMRTIAEALAN